MGRRGFRSRARRTALTSMEANEDDSPLASKRRPDPGPAAGWPQSAIGAQHAPVRPIARRIAHTHMTMSHTSWSIHRAQSAVGTSKGGNRRLESRVLGPQHIRCSTDAISPMRVAAGHTHCAAAATSRSHVSRNRVACCTTRCTDRGPRETIGLRNRGKDANATLRQRVELKQDVAEGPRGKW